MATTRIIDLTEASALQSDDSFVIDSSRGTKKIGFGNVLDATLTEEGKFADAKAVGDALADKVDAVSGKVLSSNDYTDADKTKLAGIEAGAEVNDVTSVAGKTGTVTLDAGDVSYSDETTYADGTVGAAVSGLKSDLSDLESTISHIGLSSAVKTALLACFAKVAWVDANGQDYYDDLEEALQEAENVVSISASFVQRSAKIYDTDDLDSIKQYLTVTATYTDQTSRTVTDYTLSGTLSEGTSTITVRYGGKSTTFNVTVTWGYKLKQTFTSTGTNKLDTGKKMTSGKYTLALEFTVTNYSASPTKFIIGNGTPGINYVSLQCSLSGSDKYMWGYGITWGNGKNLMAANHVGRAVVVFDYSSELSCTANMTIKDITGGGTVKTFSNTYTYQSDPSPYSITIGDIRSENIGFEGSVSKCIVEKGEWSSSDITSFITNG